MRRILASVPLSVLLLSGCADQDDEAGFTATLVTEAAGTTASAMSTSGTSTGAGASTAEPTSTGMTGAVSGSTGASPTESGPTGEASTGAADTDATTGTSTTGTTGETEASTGTTGEDTLGGHSFAIDIWPIFDDHCSCHEDANGAGKLRLAMEDAYTNIVDQPSDQVPEMLLVKPGSAQDSYLWHKLNDTQDEVDGKGKKMPPGGKLKAAELELISQWIDEGAKP